jgi:hypothetical protein
VGIQILYKYQIPLFRNKIKARFGFGSGSSKRFFFKACRKATPCNVFVKRCKKTDAKELILCCKFAKFTVNKKHNAKTGTE